MKSFIHPQAEASPPRSIWVAAFLVTMSSCGCALALDPSKAIRQYGMDVWQTEQGLPHNSVRAITQSPDGLLWMATTAGIARFDGAEFQLAGKLGSDVALSLTVLRSGTLLAGTFGAGLRSLQGATFRLIPNAASTIAGVHVMLEDDDGTIWIGTQNGLWHGDYQRGKSFQPVDGLAGVNVRALLRDRLGVLWAGTAAGLWQISGGVATQCKFGSGRPDVASLLLDHEGNLWIGTDGEGIFRHRLGEISYLSQPSGSARKILAMLQDRNQNIWFASWDRGVAKLGAREAEQSASAAMAMEWFDTKSGLPHEQVLTLFEDREGSIWAGTRGGGLVRFRDRSVQVLATADGLPHNIIWAVRTAPDGSLWFATDGGLMRSQGTSRQVFKRKDGLANDVVSSLAIDGAGTVWAGSLDSGLATNSGGVFHRLGVESGLPSLAIRALLAARNGELWVGTAAGIVHGSPGRFQTISCGPDIPMAGVRTFLEDRAERIWIGTTKGICVRNGAAVSTYTIANGLSSDSIRSIFEDSGGDIWIATVDGGLNRLRGGRIVAYRASSGLPDEDIYATTEDDSGNLWLTTAVGIARIAKSEFDRLASGDRRPLEYLLLGRSDGMHNVGCTSGMQPAGLRVGNSFYVPTLSGVAIVDLAARLRRPPAPVHIRAVSIDRVSMQISAPIQIPHDRGDLEFSYTAVTFLKPTQTRFRYMLRGFDTDWVEAGTRRTAWYTHLPPGEYTFHVQATDAEGVWNQEGASIQVTLRPAFYQTVWFQAFLVLALTSLVWGFLRHRMKAARESERRLEELVAIRTAELVHAKAEAERATQAKSDFLASMSHEIRTPLNGVLGAASLLESESDPAAFDSNLETIRISGEALLSVINDILDMTKIESGHLQLESIPFDLHALVEEVQLLVGTQAHRKGLQLSTFIDPAVEQWYCGDPGRIRQVLLNLLGNAVKFTARGRVALSVSASSSQLLQFSISDTGIGISQEHMAKLFLPFSQADMSTTRKFGGTGLGLAISHRLISLMGGSIGLASTPGEGTRFDVLVPLPTCLAPASNARNPLLAKSNLSGHVLVADDNSVNRLITSQMLIKLGFSVETVNDGLQAVQAATSRQFDFIFMDCLMPEMDGFQAASAIRATETGKHVPIIALTASAFESDRRRCLESGMDAYLAKPVRMTDLASCLSRIGSHAGSRNMNISSR